MTFVVIKVQQRYDEANTERTACLFTVKVNDTHTVCVCGVNTDVNTGGAHSPRMIDRSVCLDTHTHGSTGRTDVKEPGEQRAN